ncbi:hypothetical protein HZU40_00135 (plasmid) [Mycolicibacterium fluoranthenivorans]|uniref:Uncharacterized protein n=1 Tax=Mycolicibacterium fluoranthenivorans TaxID=258505 RepID=A0A7G8P6E9_9MYCO|nr:hypothetical protein [Mycolicibacterium fluoranthenivorans]QNJ89915.1 hypothetical protein HZU40_00135 [Mycolicibacterium fluoranthenivorans]
MSDYESTPGDAEDRRWRDRAGAIIRAVAAVGAGVAVGVSTRDLGLGVTTAAAAVSILRELLARPGR